MDIEWYIEVVCINMMVFLFPVQSSGVEKDMYEEYLSQTEIQDNVDKVNCKEKLNHSDGYSG